MAKKGYREESDSIGIVYVPRKALYGAKTQRAIDNFPISGIKMDFPFTKSFVSSLGVIKDAAARANNRLKLLPNKKAFLLGKSFNLLLALAAASLITPKELTKDLVKGKSILIPLIGKLSMALCVFAPYRAFRGT